MACRASNGATSAKRFRQIGEHGIDTQRIRTGCASASAVTCASRPPLEHLAGVEVDTVAIDDGQMGCTSRDVAVLVRAGAAGVLVESVGAVTAVLLGAVPGVASPCWPVLVSFLAHGPRALFESVEEGGQCVAVPFFEAVAGECGPCVVSLVG